MNDIHACVDTVALHACMHASSCISHLYVNLYFMYAWVWINRSPAKSCHK